jgi:uncharacterized protein (TIGR03437 family)
LFGATAAMAASSGFLLGVDYSEWADPTAVQIATDASGKLYILSLCTNSDLSCVTKVSGDGKTILWQNALGFSVAAMAVDPKGGVYITPSATYGQPFNPFVEKLNADDAGVAWKTPIGLSTSLRGTGVPLAVDSTGRVFVAGLDQTTGDARFVRLNATGVVDYTTGLNVTAAALPGAIAVDSTGTEVVVGISTPDEALHLAWLTPDTNAKSYSTVPQVTNVASLTLAVAPGGDAVVSSRDWSGRTVFQRIESTGAVKFSVRGLGLLAVDAAGNVYTGGGVRVKNSLAPCGAGLLSVIAPDGTILQATYIPGSSLGPALVATTAGSAFLVAASDPTVPPTQAGPFVTNYLSNPSNAVKLFRLSPNSSAQTFPLACIANGASYWTGPIAPGEIVTLFGNGLGPQQGVQTLASLTNPFPTQAANTQVTFDGKPAPLLWVQDAQINVAVPWSVTGPTTQVCASYNNVKTNCLSWPVGQVAPGVVTVDGTYAAALNEDGSINSAANPAKNGSIVSIFATGLGPISPSQADGTLVGLPLPMNQLPLQLFTECPLQCQPPVVDVIYAGPAPYLIAGASQINFRVTGQHLYLAVGAEPQRAYTNSFQVYVGP